MTFDLLPLGVILTSGIFLFIQVSQMENRPDDEMYNHSFQHDAKMHETAKNHNRRSDQCMCL